MAYAEFNCWLHCSAYSATISCASGPETLYHLLLTSQTHTHTNHWSYATVFVTHLVNQNLAYSTIKVYLATVRSAHVAQGKHKIFESQLTPRLLLVMKGVRKLTSISKLPRVHLPITSDILQGINTILSAELDSCLNMMKWVACCMAFFGFLHSSKFTAPSQHYYDPDVYLSLSDITLDRRHTSIWCVYILSNPKLTPLRQGDHIHWADLISRFTWSRQ